MPRLNDLDMETVKTTGSYGFSATKLDNLGSSSYTLATVCIDRSGSVYQFKKELEQCIKEVVSSCKYSPYADSLMIRVISFADDVNEIHGFKLLSTINLDDYDNCLSLGGSTALFDASENAIESTIIYGKSLTDNDYAVNGIVVVITDGDDNRSIATVNSVRTSLEKAIKSESLESLNSILIGVNVQDARLKNYLDSYTKDAGFTQFESIDKADAKTLARINKFISKSISSSSQALGTGGPSKSLSF